MALVGLVRVSTDRQLTDRQHTALRNAGCIKIFEEKVSGKSVAVANRPGLAAAIDYLRPDVDMLTVLDIKRLGRDLVSGLETLADLFNRGIGIKVLEGIGAGEHRERSLVLDIALAIAEDHKREIVRSTRQGLEAAKARGVLLGRKSVMTEEMTERAAELKAKGFSLRQIQPHMTYKLKDGTIREASLGAISQALKPQTAGAPVIETGKPEKIGLPGKVVEFLQDLEDGEITQVLNGGITRRGRLILDVPIETHRWLLTRANGMAGVGGEATPAEKRQWNEYARLIEGAEKFAALREAALMEDAPPVRKAKTGHTVYTAPDGTTRESKREYTAALAIFNPAEAIKAPWIESFHGTAALANKAGQGFARMGYRFMIVPVTTDGTTDADLAARIAALRTAADMDDIPAQEIAKAEAKRDRAAADVAQYQEREPDPKFGETAETLAGWLARAEGERDTAAATADHWRARLTSA